MMDLHYYPLDEQNCTVEIESCEFLGLKLQRKTFCEVRASNSWPVGDNKSTALMIQKNKINLNLNEV